MSFMDNIEHKLLPAITQIQPVHSSAIQSISEHQYSTVSCSLPEKFRFHAYWHHHLRGTGPRAPSTSNCLIFLDTSEVPKSDIGLHKLGLSTQKEYAGL